MAFPLFFSPKKNLRATRNAILIYHINRLIINQLHHIRNCKTLYFRKLLRVFGSGF